MPRASIIIRAADTADLPHLLALYRELNSDDDLPQTNSIGATYDTILAHPGLTIFVALDSETPVATASLVVIPNLTRGGRPYALVENVVSARSHRGEGYGRAVVCHAIEAAWTAGCYKAMLLTGRTDPAVHKFYEGCGFVQNKTGFQVRRN
ncbi:MULTISPECIES: GNAT family N-acetyltransferase [Alphaproteobacteria]|uniref:Acetyltransferase n=2 Tax=Alphaproteobacteria TaxID=28211 RepID=A0A512HEQ5_9HYPH|nr:MULTISPECIES: GNAT family N-acetyltransferase [Alphaproteobacteria]GEO83931.1 acetyltransferase [Ciceribacter naphthalenivorans]GLR21191.1 acetyltransferase [Ciceribacter naphthalenivorans]GLT04047.1 acetyltransferase [Sphingomonas psychrolutea]